MLYKYKYDEIIYVHKMSMLQENRQAKQKTNKKKKKTGYY